MSLASTLPPPSTPRDFTGRVATRSGLAIRQGIAPTNREMTGAHSELGSS
jgi:hypothetical protein